MSVALILLYKMTESSDKEFMEQDMLIERKADNDGLCSKLLKTRSSRLAAMLSLIIVYFLAEIIVGKLNQFFLHR